MTDKELIDSEILDEKATKLFEPHQAPCKAYWNNHMAVWICVYV